MATKIRKVIKHANDTKRNIEEGYKIRKRTITSKDRNYYENGLNTQIRGCGIERVVWQISQPRFA